MPDALHHVIRGTPRLGTLLLIHPMGADLTFWESCIEAWQGDYKCVACDLRSAGLSPRAPHPPAVDTHVADLVALCDELRLEIVAPVGCAMGALVAAAFAARQPHRTRAVVMTNPTPRTSERARDMLVARAGQVRSAGMQAILPGAVARAFEAQPQDERYEAYYQRFAAQPAEAYADTVLGYSTADVRSDMSAIACPALIVAGRHDLLLPPEEARAVHALIPHARYELMQDAAHFLPYQQPQRFARLVHDFLSSAAGATKS